MVFVDFSGKSVKCLVLGWFVGLVGVGCFLVLSLFRFEKIVNPGLHWKLVKNKELSEDFLPLKSGNIFEEIYPFYRKQQNFSSPPPFPFWCSNTSYEEVLHPCPYLSSLNHASGNCFGIKLSVLASY